MESGGRGSRGTMACPAPAPRAPHLMVPAARRLPQQPGDAEPRGSLLQGRGRSSETGDSVRLLLRRPEGYTISSHKAEAPARSVREQSKRKTGEGAERPRRGAGPPAAAASHRLLRFLLLLPELPRPPSERCPPGPRARPPLHRPALAAPAVAAEAVCNPQLLQSREESRDRREEPGRRRGARRRNTQAPPSSPPSPGGEGAARGGGEAGAGRTPALLGPRRTAESGEGRARARRRQLRKGSLLLPRPAPRAPCDPCCSPSRCRRGFLARGCPWPSAPLPVASCSAKARRAPGPPPRPG